MPTKANEAYSYIQPRGSVLYTEVLSPFVYNRIVEMYPTWLHPNCLTFCGFICAIASVAILVSTSPALDGSAERWQYLVSSALFFLYIIFDNTDGKQARRTGMSSAAGETFDHGVDVTVSTITTMLLADSLKLTTPILLGWCVMSHTTTFLNNWYHKITGHMSWGGRFFSVDEATLMIGLVVMGAGLFGPDMYLTEVTGPGMNPLRAADGSNALRWDPAAWGAITIGDTLTYCGWCPCIFDSFVKLYATFSATSPVEGSGKTLKDAITSLLPLIVHISLIVRVFHWCGPTNHAVGAVLIGVCFSTIGLRLMVSMKMAPEDPPYRLLTAAVVTAWGTVGAATTLPEGVNDAVTFGSDWFLTVAACLLWTIHMTTFGYTMQLINNHKPLFYATSKSD